MAAHGFSIFFATGESPSSAKFMLLACLTSWKRITDLRILQNFIFDWLVNGRLREQSNQETWSALKFTKRSIQQRLSSALVLPSRGSFIVLNDSTKAASICQMKTPTEKIAGLALTISTLGLGLIVSSISIFVLVTIAHYCHKGQRKSEERIALMLSASIYLVIFTLMIVIVSTNIQTILGDLSGKDVSSPWCVFQGYLLTLLSCTMYNLFVVQAFFRLCRIVYFSHRRLQSFRFYVIASPMQLLIAVLFTSPFLVWHSEKYLPNEHYCFLSFAQYRSVVWSAFATYGSPLLLICPIYLRIILFVRRQSGIQKTRVTASAKTTSRRYATHYDYHRLPHTHGYANVCFRGVLHRHWRRASIDVSSDVVFCSFIDDGIECRNDLCQFWSEVARPEKMATESSVAVERDRSVTNTRRRERKWAFREDSGMCNDRFQCVVYRECVQCNLDRILFIVREEKRSFQLFCSSASKNEILQMLP